MIPDKSCFISYKSISGLSVSMGNNSFVPVLGRGTAVFALNGKRVLVRNILHVPGLAVPLYSLRTHATQRGCGFMGAEESGFLVYFPDFVLSVDTAVDSHLSFDPLGRSAPLPTLHYVQPRSSPAAYPYTSLSAVSTALPLPAPPAVIVDDASISADGDALSPAPSSSSPTPTLSDLSSTLQDLAVAVQRLSTAPSKPTAVAAPTPASPIASSTDSPSTLSTPHKP